MRYVVGFMVVLALPLGVSAQDAEEGDSWLERWHPEAVEDPDERSPEPAPEDPALQLKLDDAGVEVTPSPPRTPEVEALELRVKRARTGAKVSIAVFSVGVGTIMIAAIAGVGKMDILCFDEECSEYAINKQALIAGTVLASSGLVGMVTALAIAGRSERQRKKLMLGASDSTTPRRVHWDLARSRLVF